MFGMGDGFPDSAETPLREFFVQYITIIVSRSLCSNASKVCQTALRTILQRGLQYKKGTRNFSSAERRLKTMAIVANL